MPSLLRSTFAVVFGFMVMIVAAIPMTLIAVKVFNAGTGTVTPVYLFFNVLANFVTAFLGGAVTGWIAPNKRVRHGFVLALLMLCMAMRAYSHYAGKQPAWYQVLLIIIPPFFAVLGAMAAERAQAQGEARA